MSSTPPLIHCFNGSQGTLFANPILEKLCKSFYEEEKWQRSLEYLIGENQKWAASVTPLMVSFAAAAVSIPFSHGNNVH